MLCFLKSTSFRSQKSFKQYFKNGSLNRYVWQFVRVTRDLLIMFVFVMSVCDMVSQFVNQMLAYEIEGKICQ